MEKNKNIALLFTAFYRLRNDKLTKHKIGSINPYEIKAKLFLENSSLLHSSAMIRRDFLYDNHLNYDVNIKKSQDFDFWVRISRLGKISVLPEYLCIYRVHNGQISNNGNASFIEQKKFFFDIVFRQLKDIGINDLSAREYSAHITLSSSSSRVGILALTKWVCKLLFCSFSSKFIFARKYFYKIVIIRYMKSIVYILKSRIGKNEY